MQWSSALEHLWGNDGRSVRTVANTARAVAAVAEVGTGEVGVRGGTSLVTTAGSANLSSSLIDDGEFTVVGGVILQSMKSCGARSEKGEEWTLSPFEQQFERQQTTPDTRQQSTSHSKR